MKFPETFAAELVRSQTDELDKARSDMERMKAYGAMHGLLYHLDHMMKKEAK